MQRQPRVRMDGPSPMLESLEPRLLLSNQPIISEFMAVNANGLKDSASRTSDWIEVYNPSATEQDLTGWKLEDGGHKPWTFPAGTKIGPYGYVLVWAADPPADPAPGELFTGFGLKGDGEYLALLDPSGEPVHEYSPQYPPQTADISYGIGQNIETTPVAPRR